MIENGPIAPNLERVLKNILKFFIIFFCSNTGIMFFFASGAKLTFTCALNYFLVCRFRCCSVFALITLGFKG